MAGKFIDSSHRGVPPSAIDGIHYTGLRGFPIAAEIRVYSAPRRFDLATILVVTGAYALLSLIVAPTSLDQLENNTSILDTAMSALLEDLGQRGLPMDTMVVLATEFGRTPKINSQGGRGHHPQVFSTVLAGGGIKGGMVYGKSDDRGHEVADGLVSVPDFHATIAKALGLPLDERTHGSGGRPFFVADRGTPVDAVLA